MIYQINSEQDDKTVLYLIKIANHRGDKKGQPEFSQFVYENEGYSFQEFKRRYKEKFGVDLTVPWEDSTPSGNYHPCMTNAEPIEMI